VSCLGAGGPRRGSLARSEVGDNDDAVGDSDGHRLNVLPSSLEDVDTAFRFSGEPFTMASGLGFA
jgi:hypothetical protein